MIFTLRIYDILIYINIHAVLNLNMIDIIDYAGGILILHEAI